MAGMALHDERVVAAPKAHRDAEVAQLPKADRLLGGASLVKLFPVDPGGE